MNSLSFVKIDHPFVVTDWSLFESTSRIFIKDKETNICLGFKSKGENINLKGFDK